MSGGVVFATATPSASFRERRHRGLARRGVPVRRPAVFVVAIGQRPQPWRSNRRLRPGYAFKVPRQRHDGGHEG